jgi:hypothetical protein
LEEALQRAAEDLSEKPNVIEVESDGVPRLLMGGRSNAFVVLKNQDAWLKVAERILNGAATIKKDYHLSFWNLPGNSFESL